MRIFKVGDKFKDRIDTDTCWEIVSVDTEKKWYHWMYIGKHYTGTVHTNWAFSAAYKSVRHGSSIHINPEPVDILSIVGDL